MSYPQSEKLFIKNVIDGQNDHVPAECSDEHEGGKQLGQHLDKFVLEFEPGRITHPLPIGSSEPAFLDSRLIRGCRHKEGGRNGPRSKAEIAKERQELLDQTNHEIDEIVAEYHDELPRSKAESIGAAYCRYSTKFQCSIADQIREIFKDAVRLKIFIPREMIFFDLAVRGITNSREGLNNLRIVLEKKKVQVLILFATNRLYRKQYRTLAFVDQVHKGLGIRCIFVKSGINTNDKQRWEMLLSQLAAIDQFTATMNVENIRAAHIGLLDKQLVYGTVTYGYRGEPIEGTLTKRGKPRCRIVMDLEEAEIVKKIFYWYVEEHVSINEIIRRLNDDQNIPLTPQCQSGQWTRIAVKGILENPRYRGLWNYGVNENVFIPDKNYSRKVVREVPLHEKQIEELRIVSDQIWYEAQSRLTKLYPNGGRWPKDGDRQSRPKILNGILVCPEHDQRLYAAGPYGRLMICRRCYELKGEDRPLYSALNRKLALKLTCRKLAELIQHDSSLVKDVIAACQFQAESMQRPDPSRVEVLQAKVEKITSNIQFNMRHGGNTEKDQEEIGHLLLEKRRERADIMLEITQLKEASGRIIIVPDEEQVLNLINKFSTILIAAANGQSDEAVSEARDIIESITDGRIMLFQQGERKPHRGWLQGHFTVYLLDYFVEKITNVPLNRDSGGIEVIIDYRRPLPSISLSERAYHLFVDEGLLEIDIAGKIEVSRNRVTKLLKDAYARRNQEMPDGREHRVSLTRKQRKTPEYQKIAEKAAGLWNAPANFPVLEIARQLSTSDTMAWKALAYWHQTRSLPIPTAKDRRERIMFRARQMFDSGVQIKDLANMFGYTTRGMTLLLQESYSRTGEKMPDGRSHRHAHKKADQTC